MPLPKDPEKVKEWKRKVGFRTLLGKKYTFQLVEPPSNKEILLKHAELHQLFKTEIEEDIPVQHSLIVREMERRKIKHLPYDELDNKTNNDEELLLKTHVEIHSFWALLQKGQGVENDDGKKITKEELIKLHDEIVKKLEERGFKHTTPLIDELEVENDENEGQG